MHRTCRFGTSRGARFSGFFFFFFFFLRISVGWCWGGVGGGVWVGGGCELGEGWGWCWGGWGKRRAGKKEER